MAQALGYDVTVLPKVELRGDARFLVIPPDAGYGPVAEPMESTADPMG